MKRALIPIALSAIVCLTAIALFRLGSGGEIPPHRLTPAPVAEAGFQRPTAADARPSSPILRTSPGVESSPSVENRSAGAAATITPRATHMAGTSTTIAYSAASSSDGFSPSTSDALPAGGQSAASPFVSSSPSHSAAAPALPVVPIPLAYREVNVFIQSADGTLHYSPAASAPATLGAAPASGKTATPSPDAPGSVVLSESGAAALDGLRQEFSNSLSGVKQDPADPHYAGAWRQAQSASDQRFIQQYGYQAFQAYQLAAEQRAQADKQQAAK